MYLYTFNFYFFYVYIILSVLYLLAIFEKCYFNFYSILVLFVAPAELYVQITNYFLVFSLPSFIKQLKKLQIHPISSNIQYHHIERM